MTNAEEEAAKSIDGLKTLIAELNKQKQHMRNQLKELVSENHRQVEKLKKHKEKKRAILGQVDELKEDLEIAQAQITGYKTQSDILKKELEQANKKRDEFQQKVQ